MYCNICLIFSIVKSRQQGSEGVFRKNLLWVGCSSLSRASFRLERGGLLHSICEEE